MNLFGVKFKLSRIAAVPQEHRRPRLILNLSAQPDEGTPSVNETTVKEIAPESMQFERALPHIFQAIWEAEPIQGPVQVSKLDVTDHMGRKELECLAGKLRSMHLAVPGAVEHLYHIQRALTQIGKDRTLLSAEFHW